MSVSSVKRCLWGTNNPNMEETGILEKITRSGFCYPALNQVGFSGNSTDRPRASTVEVLSVAGPIAGSETLEAVQAQHVTGAGGVGLSAAEREFFPLAQGDGSSPAAGD